MGRLSVNDHRCLADCGPALHHDFRRPFDRGLPEPGGEHPDLVLAEQAAIDDLQKGGGIQSAARLPLGRVGLGVAVGRSKEAPDLSSPDALKQALLSAKSVLQPDPDESAWGRQAFALLEQLGVAQQVRPKLRLGTGNNPLAPVGLGDADIGLHSIVVILQSQSVKLAAPVPSVLQQWTRFDVAVVEDAPNASEARRFMEYLRGPTARAIWQRKGLESP